MVKTWLLAQGSRATAWAGAREIAEAGYRTR